MNIFIIIIIIIIIYHPASDSAISPKPVGEKWGRPFWSPGIPVSSDTFIPFTKILFSLKIILAASIFSYW